MSLRALFITVSYLLTLLLLSCGSSGNDEPNEPVQRLILRTQSIENNQTVDPSVNTITLSYNNLIQISDTKDITLNGKKVRSTANGMDLTVNVELEHWKTYQLDIPECAVTIKGNPKATSPAVTIKFDTKTGYDPDKPQQVSAALINHKATKEAKELYQYLVDNYGRKMMTGAMCGVAWETSYADFIYQQTGAFPKVVGFDYIHLSWSPANWIDYGDITPVKSVHDKGCIVQIQWHWNVPKNEGSNDRAFYLEGNNFNPANILVDGSWENKVARADIEKLAGYMKLLQDANIPVLWRPFHEAAGDYKWGAWFWWGAQGVEVTKKLYHYLYHQLTDVYGLNNLIWVWTVQTSNEGKPASLSQMKAAYPGDEYVDIVGADIYPDGALTDQSATFRLVEQTADGHKIVALTECGNLVDPQKAMDNAALWSYFMQWYDMNDNGQGFNNYYGPEQWKKLLESDFVISAD